MDFRLVDAPLVPLLIALAAALPACGSDTGSSETSATTSGTTADDTATTADPATSAPTSGDATSDTAPTSTTSVVDTTTTNTTPDDTTSPPDTTGAVDPETTGTTGAPPDTTGTVDPSGTTSTTGTSTDETTDGGDESTGDDTNDCIPTEMNEVTCDDLDNDCDGYVDNIDVGNDGICDCLNIGILGNQGFAPTSNFEAWLEDKGSAVTRTLLLNNPGVVTPALLGKYDLVLLDRIERPLSADEATALEAFVKEGGNGLITLIGYNFDNNNPAPERDRANTALAPFGLAYQGGYFGNAVIPTFDQTHPVSEDIFDVNFYGGIAPVDTGNQGTSKVFATYQMMNAGIAHETADGGRVIVWGDEWITFDSDWQGFADVEDFWVNMVDWARPQDFCALPQ